MQCPHCGAPYSMETASCKQCGKFVPLSAVVGPESPSASAATMEPPPPPPPPPPAPMEAAPPPHRPVSDPGDGTSSSTGSSGVIPGFRAADPTDPTNDPDETDKLDTTTMQPHMQAFRKAFKAKVRLGEPTKVRLPPRAGLGPRLVVDGVPAIPLVPNVHITIGRDPTCNVIVTSNLVSRRHSLVASLGEAYVVTDLESRNGTVVNGERLQKDELWELAPGDEIDVGGAVFRYLVGAERSAEEIAADPTPRPGKSRRRRTDTRKIQPGLSGKLSDMSLLELLQSVHLYRKSGTLDLRIGDMRAWITIDQGELHSAQAGELRGIDAVKSLLGAEDGTFRFEKARDGGRFPPGPREIDVTMQKVLIEAQKELDESTADG